jgi:hypothetical protein
MSETKRDRIEVINQKIIALMLKRKQAQRHKSWAQEEAITENMNKLEAQIRIVEGE